MRKVAKKKREPLDPNLVRRWDRVTFVSMFGHLVGGVVRHRRGEHVEVIDRVKNVYVIYVEDIVSRARKKSYHLYFDPSAKKYAKLFAPGEYRASV